MAQNKLVTPDNPFRSDTLLVATGLCALLLPVVLPIVEGLRCGTYFPADSISQYYHLGPHVIFVGAMMAVATLLAAYEGWQDRPTFRGRLPGIVGTAGALVVALVPTPPTPTPQTVSACLDFTHALNTFRLLPMLPERVVGFFSLHMVGACALFVALAVMCGLQFQRSRHRADAPEDQQWKQVRNGIYLFCAFWMVAPGVVYLSASVWWHLTQCAEHDDCSLPVGSALFFVEAIALWAFGIAWLVRSRVLLGYGRLPQRNPKAWPWRWFGALAAIYGSTSIVRRLRAFPVPPREP